MRNYRSILKTLSGVLSLMFFMSSCSPQLSTFNSKMLKEGKWSDNELKRIQFYLSDDIVIYRKVTEGASEITSGQIKIVRGEKIEEVRIKAGTPGVFLFRAKEENFAIGFDQGSDKRYLMFGPNPKRADSYVLLASEWENRAGKVRYDDKFYFTNSESALASLMVDYSKIRRQEVSTNTAGGRRVE
jgi:hypothetical protein